jgi:hypothetical protein
MDMFSWMQDLQPLPNQPSVTIEQLHFLQYRFHGDQHDP